MIRWLRNLLCATGSLLPVWLAVTTALAQAPPEPPGPGPTAVQIQVWIADLAAGQFATRETAELQLVKAGPAALDAVAAAANSSDMETRHRAFRILKRQLSSPTAESAARQRLQSLSQSKQGELANAATRMLANHDEEQSQQFLEQVEMDKIGRVRRLGGVRVGVPAIRLVEPPVGGEVAKAEIRIGAIAGAAVGGFSRTSISVSDGERKIDIERGTTRIQIQDSKSGDIKMSVTQPGLKGERETKEYTAKSAAELKTKHPEAHKLYTEHTAGIDIFRAPEVKFPAIPARPRLPIKVIPPFVPEPEK